mmetsp:Transcript_51725/g.62204  ORF Transcript_51725/g.62204 Transcript_51725/m.62204 type:complete len:149 (-) Transcript_51725:153-599(-)
MCNIIITADTNIATDKKALKITNSNSTASVTYDTHCSASKSYAIAVSNATTEYGCTVATTTNSNDKNVHKQHSMTGPIMLAISTMTMIPIEFMMTNHLKITLSMLQPWLLMLTHCLNITKLTIMLPYSMTMSQIMMTRFFPLPLTIIP